MKTTICCFKTKLWTQNLTLTQNLLQPRFMKKNSFLDTHTKHTFFSVEHCQQKCPYLELFSQNVGKFRRE